MDVGNFQDIEFGPVPRVIHATLFLPPDTPTVH